MSRNAMLSGIAPTSEKAELYARIGIPEYWVVDLNGRRIVQHGHPDTATGQWASVREFGEDEDIAPLTAPETKKRVVDLLA